MSDDHPVTRDAIAIAEMVGLDKSALERSVLFAEAAINKMIVAEVVMQYTLADQLLSEITASYFLNVEPFSARFSSRLSERERVFNHHVLDEMYLLKKLAIVHAARPVPSDVTNKLRKLNALRNALAHSFYPENRKEYQSSGKVMYGGHDIRTPAGLQKFIDDAKEVVTYLHEQAYGPGLGAGLDEAPPL
ncbi:hypothetical protein N2603_20410 [Bradyrhizobium huanghuaihaiense]|uniref:hypothetical protein n=1 Tax=Bradyrhizobium huanghuaihaiense TaxID=990078 RepID=UPI0021AA3B0C|nr:hypothetical protein [Bradyrhizobium sp. CB3035]UWU80738.1 hypothetical protein N2603_20410 [Bradyrhizobium sp. CB3035]